MSEQEDEYLVERFTLDDVSYNDVVEVIKAAYLTNDPEEGGTISFNEKSLNIFYGSPAIPRDYFVWAIYKPTGKIVGFLGATPRLLYIDGKTYKTGVPGLLAVHPDHRRKNLAVRMGLVMLSMGKGFGFEGGFGFFEPEAHGIDTGKALSQQAGLASRDVITITQFIIRVFNVKKMSTVIKTKWYEKLGLAILQGLPRVKDPSRVRKFRPDDAARMFELMDDYRTRNQASFIREEEDISWFMIQPGVNCVVHEDTGGKVDGFMVAWEFEIAGFGNSCPLGWIDMIHTYRLKTEEAADLARYFAQVSEELGWVGLQSPFIPYFDPAPLKKARFVFFPKKLIVNFTSATSEWTIPFPEKITSMYFDWR
ncbi:MAG TPA: GNAT family N-acetyltransferase [Candidatus Lokiarchaeia archaeon]|nr:GNAT family N-acetyltransferase [Candidatus Lokiarchaeia archaeon]